ncbi:MAG: CvpA family protein [Elusimicrobia bacterium]|nr:CvpA family protein [Elusimicrobiota bacterium]
MNLVDISIFLLIIILAWFGSWIGILTTVSYVISGLIGSVLANLLYVKFAVFFSPKPSGLIISYLIIFVSVTAVAFYLCTIISKLLNILFLGLVDRFFGALLGVVLGVIFCGAILNIMVIVPLSSNIEYYVENSTFTPLIINNIIIPVMKPFSKNDYKVVTKDIPKEVVKKIKNLPSPHK